MDILWAELLPLLLGSALVPAQLVVTILMLKSEAGTRVAFAFIGGMTVVRLLQGAVFGLLVSRSSAGDDAATAETLKSALLLIVAILLLVMAVKMLLNDEDTDAPPPAWHARTASMRPRQAFLVGAGLLLVGPKFWVFNLSAIAVIEEAALGRTAGVATYLAFVALAALPLLAIVVASLTAPDRSDVLLEHVSAWLKRNNRTIVVAVGLVFGGWFLAQALTELGVL